MLKIQRTTERAGVVLAVCGRLDTENVDELRESLDAVAVGTAVVLDLTDLLLVDRDVIRLLREWEGRRHIVFRNCPAYIRAWMAADDLL